VAIFNAVPDDKGRVRTAGLAFGGCDTFVVAVDSIPLGSFTVSDSFHYQMQLDQMKLRVKSRLFLAVAPTTIRQVTISRMYGTNSSFFVVQQDTFQASYAMTDSFDYDLYLVNDSTRDTCFWHKTNPDWGVPKDSIDNPKFSGDRIYNTDVSDSVVHNLYFPAAISCNAIANGTYSVYVRYYDGPASCDSATPKISMELGLQGNRIINFIQYSPPRPLAKGEVWYAGKINFPSFGFTPQL